MFTYEPWMLPAGIAIVIVLCIAVSILTVAAPDKIYGVEDDES